MYNPARGNGAIWPIKERQQAEIRTGPELAGGNGSGIVVNEDQRLSDQKMIQSGPKTGGLRKVESISTKSETPF